MQATCVGGDQRRGTQQAARVAQAHGVATDAVAHCQKRQLWPALCGPVGYALDILIDPGGHAGGEASQCGRRRAADAAIVVAHHMEAAVGQRLREGAIDGLRHASGRVEEYDALCLVSMQVRLMHARREAIAVCRRNFALVFAS
ncbi:hypothetical protein KP05_14765 [Cobetia amphilecti]|nr:hypothetical protein KP05_14765 [Cobetia amphilecti]